MSSDIFNIENLLPAFEDLRTTEILINSIHSLVVCKDNAYYSEPNPFANTTQLVRSLQNFALSRGIRLDPLYPSNGGIIDVDHKTLRWHCVLPPIALDGPIFSLRRHRFEDITLNDFDLTSAAMNTLQDIFDSNSPLIIAGPTGCGKTTFLTSILKSFCLQERVFCLEHLAELPLLSNKWVRFVERQNNVEGFGGYSLSNILKDSLRLRPDRIIVGEIRSEEAFAFLNALDCGHNGVLTTIHASSPVQVQRRLESLSHTSNVAFVLEESGCKICQLCRATPPQITGFYEIREGRWEKIL